MTVTNMTRRVALAHALLALGTPLDLRGQGRELVGPAVIVPLGALAAEVPE